MLIDRCESLCHVLSSVLGFFLVLGSVVLCLVNPSKELIAALVFEFAMAGVLLGYRLFRSKHKSNKAKSLIVRTLEDEWRLLKIGRRAVALVKTAVLFGATLIVAAEISAMTLAYCGQMGAARFVCTTMPSTRLFGMHPAYALEVMTGAYIAAGKYRQAEPYYPLILSVRKQLYGEHHEYIPGFYADLADLRVKENRLPEAEHLYRHSLALSREIFGDTTGGSVFTKLGDLLIKEHRLPDAEQAYKDALAMRTHQFGARSLKVCETLDHYRRLLLIERRSAEADATERLERDILEQEGPNQTVSAYFPIVVLLISLVGSYLLFGRDGYLTNFAIKCLREKEAAGDLDALMRYHHDIDA